MSLIFSLFGQGKGHKTTEDLTTMSFSSSYSRLSNDMNAPSKDETVERRRRGSEQQQRRSSGQTTMSFDEYDTDYYGVRRDIMDPSEEGEEGVEVEEEPLSWRLDPSLSLSDWTIVIHGQESRSVDEYHVHRNILAVGPSKSDYFCSLFRNSDRLAESESKTSHITLEDRAAQAFPNLLDFMYSPNNQLVVTTDTAISLRYLAQYFGVRLLFKKVMEFLREDMNLTNIHTYISDSLLFQDEKVTSFAAEKCVADIQEISASSPLLQMMDPSFFLDIVSSPEIDTCGVSCHLSALVAVYCHHHKTELDAPMFQKLTDRKHIPLIDRSAALTLLELESEILPPTETTSELTCLQKRCIKVMALHWREASEKEEAATLKTFRKLPGSVLAELLHKSLSVAKQHVETTESKFAAEKELLEKAFMESLEEMDERREQAEHKIATMENEAKSEICRLRSEVLALKRQTEQYKKELNRFERVPVAYSFANVQKSTYHRLSGGEPYDDAATFQGYGRQRPSTMPRLREFCAEDGYLVVENKNRTEYRWPVFFYRHEEKASDEFLEKGAIKGRR